MDLPAPSGAMRTVLLAACLAGSLEASGGVGPASTARARPRDERPMDGRTNQADYTIEARVDGDDKTLTGRLVLDWTNRSGDSVQDLWFHLYWNAFASNRSTHLYETRGTLGRRRSGEDPPDQAEDEWGWQRVTSIVFEGEELLPSMRFESPDREPSSTADVEDRTVFSVDLPRAVASGETIEVRVEWESQIPRLRRRTGYKDDFLFIAHWFPKLGVYEGGRGWNCHEFHASTEFYSNYGTYDVTLDLPEMYEGKVGGSGVLVSPVERRGDRVITRFLAPSMSDRARVDRTGRRPLVHGFAWTASPRFSIRTDTFHFDEWAEQYPEEVEFVRGVMGDDFNVALRDVRVTLLIQSERRPQRHRHFDATCAALFFYGLWFGEYPYEHITVVDPPWGGRAAGGMEYPTLFTCGTRLFTTPDMHTPEGVTIHEAGHQFWYGLVGNNEFEAAWLDEGFNSYADSETIHRRYGPRRATTSFARIPLDGEALGPLPGGSIAASILSARRIPLPMLDFDLRPIRQSGWVDLWRDRPQLTYAALSTDSRWHDRVRYLSAPDVDPVDTFGWKYLNRTSYSTNSYPRTAVALRSLSAIVGRERFLRGMRNHAESWRYRHPYPDDFFAAFNEGAGVDVSWYFDEVFRGTGTVDWSVSVDQFRRAEPRGFRMGPDGEFLEIEAAEKDDESGDEDPIVVNASPIPAEGGDDETAPSPPEEDSEDDEDERPYEVEIVVRRTGELRLPLEIELTWTDGEKERVTWSRDAQEGKRWIRLRRSGPEKLKSVVLDPERGLYFDMNMSDNQWYDETDLVAPLRWTERVFSRFAHLLHWQAGLGG